MEKSQGQRQDERTAPITYRAEIYAKREGDQEVRLDRSAKGGSIGELAEDLVAQAPELVAQAREMLERFETERGQKEQTAAQSELSGRRRRSWE